MKRIGICAVRKDRKHILEMLQRIGVVELEEEKLLPSEKIDTSSQRAVFERTEQNAVAALSVLDEYVPQKTSLFDSLRGKRRVSQEIYNDAVKRREEIISCCDRIAMFKKRISAAEARICANQGNIEAVQPWLGCDCSMKIQNTKTSDILYGSLPISVTDERINEATESLRTAFTVISADKRTRYLAFVSLRQDTGALSETLRKLGFLKPSADIRHLPEKQKEIWELEIAADEAEIRYCKEELGGFEERRDDIKIIADYYAVRAEKYRALGTLRHTKRTFFISGFVPAAYASRLAELITVQFTASVEIEDDGDAPVMLENNAFSESFEPVLESFGMPGKKESDPTSVMGAFYVFMFGLMLSDAGYGLLMAIACFALVKKFRGMDTGLRKSLKMFMYCGISTTVWGILFGGYFGDAVTVIADTFFHKTIEIPALWFVPLDNPMRLLLYSLLFGLVHLFTGFALKGSALLKEKDIKGFVFDVIAWFMLLIGLLLMLMSSSIYASLAGSSLNLGKYGLALAEILAAAGALIILFMAGRSSKNPGKRIAKGAYSLYDITGWLSDLLSYSRLLALGLATGVIAQVVNSMCQMVAEGKGFFGAVLFIIVFLIGHTLNIAINVLGAYVHTCRLQYVEFFGKFYEGGGRKFEPFREDTGYIKIEEEISWD